MSSDQSSQILDQQSELLSYIEGKDSNVLLHPKKIYQNEKKLKYISERVCEIGSQAQKGLLMGSILGGSMGAFIGIAQAFQTRKLILMPISIIASGTFFGVLMMGASVLRNDSENIYKMQNQVMRDSPFWRIKYSYPTTKDI